MQYIKLMGELFRLRKNIGKSKQEVKNLQQKALRDMIRYAFENSQYYHRVYTLAGMTKENIDIFPIEKLPFTNKQILIENFEEIVVTDDLDQDSLAEFDQKSDDIKETYGQNYHLVHSSGSTGKARYYVYDEPAWNRMLIGIIRGALWDMSILEILKLLWDSPRILYIAATDGRYGGAMAVGDGIDGLKAKQLHLDINTPLHEWCTSIAEFKPNIVIGYPSAIKILAGLVQSGEINVNFTRIITCGEPLSGGMRDYLETVFQQKIVNFYGASESLALGVEIDPKEGMFLFDDLNYVEIIDGQMYFTSLYNKIQPLIRYQLSDKIVQKESTTNFGCNFTRIDTILGRDEDMMWFEDIDGKKEFLHPLAVEGICIDGIIDYQFRQIDKKFFEIHVEKESHANAELVRVELTKLMDSILEKKKLKFVHYMVVFSDQISANPNTGKKPLIVKQCRTGEKDAV